MTLELYRFVDRCKTLFRAIEISFWQLFQLATLLPHKANIQQKQLTAHRPTSNKHWVGAIVRSEAQNRETG
jgi:hypothetical protein